MYCSFSLAVLAGAVSAAPSFINGSALVDPIPSASPSTMTGTVVPVPLPATLSPSLSRTPAQSSVTSVPASTWTQPPRVNDYPFTREHPPVNNTVTGPCKDVTCHTGFECHVYGNEAKCVITGGSQCGRVWCPGNMSCCNSSCSMCVPLYAACTQQFCEQVSSLVP
ncbi:hypothetical protein BROUX41_001935 [Berkeleyomyces rouxiae]|uniref:uncharacterized protein n=1 Tax=Berkeleyomyces rouxiae TaxID=2035830 RepID=UPI003B76F18D